MNEENSSDLFFVKKSKIHGNGLFAKKFIKKDKNILDLKYILFPKEAIEKYKNATIDYSEIEKEFIKYYELLTFDNYLNKLHFKCLNGHSHIIYAILLGDTSFINNSFNDENQNIKILYSSESKRIHIRTTRDIEIGEEILMNYGGFIYN